MKHVLTFALATLLWACAADPIAPTGEAINAKGGTRQTLRATPTKGT